MKKTIICLILAIVCIITLVGCGNNDSSNNKHMPGKTTTQQQSTTNKNYEQEISSKALELLREWKTKGYDDYETLMNFMELNTTVVDSLGVTNRVGRLVNNVYKYGVSGGNKTVVDMGIKILTSNADRLSVNFIDDTTHYVYYNSGYSKIFPVFDLYTGLYGLYDVDNNKYIHEPTLTYLSAPDSAGYICVQYNGYYGCYNSAGEKVIGFMYDYPISFLEDVAVVRTNDKYGVINRAGETVLKSQYSYIKICSKNSDLSNSVIVANWPEGAQGKLYRTNLAYGVYTLDGTQIIPHSYSDYIFKNGNIYMEENTYDNKKWYDLYDGNGKLLFGEGTNIPDICSVSLPGNFGISIGRSATYKTNINGVVTPNRCDYWYTYITDSLEYLNDGVYQMEFYGYEVTPFNQKGYAVASIQGTREGSTQTRVVLDKNGVVLNEFADIYTESNYKELKKLRPSIDNVIGGKYDSNQNWEQKWRWLPIDANDYLYILEYDNDSSIKLYIRSTGEVLDCDEASMIDGTNLTIIKDFATNLYGLYDGESLVLDTVYNSISYENGKVTTTRGAEKTVYTPIN